jgi:iron complex outermembrane receptor protein
MRKANRIRSRTLSAMLLASAALVPGAAWAQESPTESTDATQVQPAAGSAATGDEEIVVTAQRRAQRLTDVPLSITALPSQLIEETRISQIENLATAVPNVDIKEQVPGAIPVVTIRGIGLDDFSSTNSPSAGVYVDEVPLASISLMSNEIYDLERIEVLKGPQGTLYGRNSTAGAVNIITARPQNEFAARFAAGYGNFETFDAEGFVNVPLGDTLAARISARTVQQGEGYWRSRLLPDETIGERNIITGRAQLRWRPSADVDVNLKVEGLRSRSELGQPEFFGTIARGSFPPVPCAPVLAGRIDNTQCSDFFGYTDTDGDPFLGDWARDAIYDVDAWDATLRIEAGLGGGITLRSISGYRWQDRSFDIDSDATPARQVDFVQNDTIEQFTQEVHLAGRTGIAEWLVGAFYSHDHVTVFTPGNLLDLFVTQVEINADQSTDSVAGFANVEWHFDDRLSLITGLRLTWEQRDYVGGTTDLNPFGFSFLCGPAGLCAPGVPGPVALTFRDDSISDTNLTGRIALEFHPMPDSLLYASVSRGRKSGGFFAGITTDNRALIPYRPETLTAYEVGGRAYLANRTVLLNGSLFYYDYDDVQSFVRDDGGAVPVQRLNNIDHARVYGADLDLTWRPVTGLELFGGIGLLDTRLSAFNTQAGNIPAGNELPNAPHFTFTGRARYEFPITTGLKASVLGTAHYSDPVFKDAANDPLIRADSWWVFDARVAFGAADDRWEIAFWGRNLSDNQHVVQGLDVAALGFGNRNYNAPRTYGVTGTIRF